jgi:hypothetical protein
MRTKRMKKQCIETTKHRDTKTNICNESKDSTAFQAKILHRRLLLHPFQNECRFSQLHIDSEIE